MGSLSLLSSFFDRDGRMQHWFAVHWARMILATGGVHVHVEGAEHIDPSQAAVYTSNHLSALDIPVLYSCFADAVPHHGEARAVQLSVHGVAPDALRPDSD